MSTRLTIDPPTVARNPDPVQDPGTGCQVGPPEPDCPYCWGPETD
ncbi:hypothetical protein GCM10023081_40460 [Arthrobacter ginkgonis]|uniref:Uncharacterized protein n=1 Tax=Arthrobacter ginkgonis TaxID=1630594 RepID=A0ABP7D4Y5_9MICC